MTGRPLRLLILEDRPEDAELALRELRRAGFDPSWRRVDDEAGFKANLDPELDLVLADYHQPQFDALHDSLTNLPNRLMLREELDRMIAGRSRSALSLLLLDIDNFKEINDSFGHQVGDVLLRQIGPRLRERLDVGTMIARLGGDEFAI